MRSEYLQISGVWFTRSNPLWSGGLCLGDCFHLMMLFTEGLKILNTVIISGHNMIAVGRAMWATNAPSNPNATVTVTFENILSEPGPVFG